MITGYWAGMQKFEIFLATFAQPEVIEAAESYDHLADHVYPWIAYGHGATACGGDFTIFLTAFAFIADRWACHPGFPRYGNSTRPMGDHRAPSKILDLQCSQCRRVFDPQFFKLLAHDPDFLNRSVAEAEAGA